MQLDFDMQMIHHYAVLLSEECHDAKDYAEFYLIYKNSHPQWSKMYSEMAVNELTHAEYIRRMGQEFVDGLTWVSEKDRNAWKELIEMHASTESLVRTMLSK